MPQHRASGQLIVDYKNVHTTFFLAVMTGNASVLAGNNS
jgi:hypothetical protein